MPIFDDLCENQGMVTRSPEGQWFIARITFMLWTALICNEHRTTPEDHQKVEDMKTTFNFSEY
ncbi:hypothetical protein C0J52_04773 [Blattella germanica]|nr:hypothetical protein C0J52_04773 [Blattella germanica]